MHNPILPPLYSDTHPAIRSPFRAVRRFLWAHPPLYEPIGRWRNRMGPKPVTDIWLGGYPRSANSLLWKLLEALLPDSRIEGHCHLPPRIIQLLGRNLPGALLVREPKDAIVSWAIYHHRTVQDCLEYYLDFHRTLKPFRTAVYVITFQGLTNDPRAVVTRFLDHWALSTKARAWPDSLLSSAFESVNNMPHSQDTSGRPDEMRVSRPSTLRDLRKEELQNALHGCAALRTQLDEAERLYEAFRQLAHD